MEVAEEDNAQIAKRQAIQAIMRDTSLTPQEKQKKIQQFMATGGGGQASSASTPSPAPAPTPPADPEPASLQTPAATTPAATTPAGGDGQAVKRQAIQAIMRDNSLTPQERQKKIQQFMAGGGKTDPAPAPAPVPSPSTAPIPTPQPKANSRQAMISAVMRDQTLTAQERQKKIQELMAGNSGAPQSAPPPSDAASGAPAAPAASPPASTSRQKLMQQVMQDTSLTAKEKQQKIQAILKSDNNAGAAEASEAVEPSPKVNPAPASNSPAIIQEVMRDTSLTPQERQKKIQEIMARSPASAADAAAAPVVATRTRGSGVGAVASSGADPAARKGARGSSTITSTAAMNAALPSEGSGTMAGASSASSVAATPSRGSGVGAVASSGVDPAARKGARSSSSIAPAASAAVASVSSEPAPYSPPPARAGAVASSGADPASRKGARTSSSISTGSVAASTASIEPAAMANPSIGAVSSSGTDPTARKGARVSSASRGSSAAGVGALSGSRHEDPAARKASRASGRSRTSSATSSVSAPPQQEESGRANPWQSRSTSTAPALSYQDQQINQVRNLEADLLSKANAAPAQTNNRPAGSAIMPPIPQDRPLSQTQVQPQSLSPSIVPSPQPVPQQETYAGVGLTGPDIAGADAGGIQAYVAGEPQEEIIGATEVVTDEQLEEEDKLKQSRLLRKGTVLCCILLVAIIVPIAIVVPGGDDIFVNTTEAPTSAPSAPPTGSTFADLLNELQVLYDNDERFEEAFSSYDTPQYQAADWAANIAPLDLSGSDPRMISRYALATFHYATDGENWASSDEWLTDENECDWLGVSCADPENQDYSVTKLSFRTQGATGNEIGGTLPFEMGLLTNIEDITLNLNRIQGTIPESLSRLTSLRILSLARNDMTGTFPDFLVTPSGVLGKLFLEANNFTGPIPGMSSSSLTDLRIGQTGFTGSIPADISGLEALNILRLDGARITGSLPEELYSITSLTELELSDNSGLVGTLSENLGGLQRLKFLQLRNTGMSGPLPQALFGLASLEVLNVAEGSFNGQLSTNFAQMPKISQIFLNNNTFTGPIPSASFAALSTLRFLYLHDNDLTGIISADLCARRGEGFAFLSQLTTDCSGEAPEVACDCCSDCF